MQICQTLPFVGRVDRAIEDDEEDHQRDCEEDVKTAEGHETHVAVERQVAVGCEQLVELLAASQKDSKSHDYHR